MIESFHGEIEELLQWAINVHLSSEDLGRYHDGVADELDGARIAAHLRRCLICSRRYETMQEILAAFSVAADTDVARTAEAEQLPGRPLPPVSSEPAASWRVVWRRLLQMQPAFGAVAGAPEQKATWDIRAYLLREEGERLASAYVTRMPCITPDGRLVMGVRVAKSFFHPGEVVTLTLALLPEGQLLETGVVLAAGEEGLINLALPPELQSSWRERVGVEGAKLPFEFVLRPVAHAPEREYGEAAGVVAHVGPHPRRSEKYVHVFFHRFARVVYRIVAVVGKSAGAEKSVAVRDGRLAVLVGYHAAA